MPIDSEKYILKCNLFHTIHSQIAKKNNNERLTV